MKEKTHIIIDNIIFYLQKSGGVSVVWQELISRLNKNDAIRTEYLEYDKKPENIFYEQIDFGAMHIHRVKLFFLKIQRYFNLRMKKEKEPHIFHSSYYRYSKNRKAINITTVHDFTYEYFTNGLAAKVHFWQKRKAILHSDYVICISESTKHDLLKFIPEYDPSRIRVIYNGVSDDYFQIPDEKNDFDLYRDSEYVVFVGARTGYKNFDLVVDSLVGTAYKLVIVGKPLSKTETERINSKIGASAYTHVGYVPNAELNKIYNKAYALMYPSSYEGFGIPILEAQRAGCPVIGYNASSVPEIMDDERLLIKELNPERIQQCLSVLSDKSVRNDIISQGISNAMKFSWNKMYAEVVELYQEAVYNKMN